MGQSHQTPAVQAPTSTPTQGPASAADDQSLYGNAFLATQMGGHEEEHEHGHAHGVEPDPGGATPANLDTDRPTGAAVPSSVRDPIFAELRRSARASALMDRIDEEGDLDFPMKWSDRGSYHSNGSIWLDRRESEGEWVGTLAHEMVHLLTYVSGQAANARRMGRQEFVDAKMADEINAQAAAYVTCLQLGNDNGGAGFSEFVEWLRQDHAELMVSESDAEADTSNAAEIERLARNWLADKYRNEWTTSNTGENYYDYWGGYWDEVNGS